MGADDGRPFRPADLAFFGATTASVTHELKNVLTIINESAGLLGDLSAGVARGRALDPARVGRMSQDIGRNVDRAVEIINRLNRFAHSVDEPVTAVDLTRMLADVAALAGRFANLRNVPLEAALPDAPLLVRTYAFGLQQAAMGAIQVAVLAETGTRPVTVSLRRSGGEARIEVARGAAVPGEATMARWELVQVLMSELGGSARVETLEGDARALVLSLPVGT